MMRFVKFLTGALYHGVARDGRRQDTGTLMMLLSTLWAVLPPILFVLAVFLAACRIGYPGVGAALGGVGYLVWLMMLR